ncbi:M23 family metallopeptidase [Flavisolibacter tropicus]|uniref:M23 family metallopeptidase n=1 Tax=Flavisolibacter tropicus TaxID=1492898 RepID=UPI000829CA67|nr:M23 family metallopeptidase [Flavisolibacter tropicus]
MKNLLLVFVAIATISFSFVSRPSVKPYSTSISSALVFPVAGNRSVIKDKWGASRAGGIRKHKGIDIHARKGTPVVAVCDGVISDRDNGGFGGKTLWLKSPKNTWSAYYAHLDKQFVKQGQWVRKGQVIGTVGNTGNARTTPSHLHFGVKKGGSWVNPLPYVKGATKVVVKSPSTNKTTKRARR